MGKKVEPRFYKQANISKKFKGLREILEILANFWAWLCYLSTNYGWNREIEVELFRGDNMLDDTNYKEGEKYRFITFQSCSTNMNIAASYLTNADSAFYTILI